MTISACYNLLLCLHFSYIVSLFVYSVSSVATTLLNALVPTSWKAVRNFSKCFSLNVDDFILYGLFECI